MPARNELRRRLSSAPHLIAACAACAIGSSASAQSVIQGPIVNPANGHAYYRLSSSTWTAAKNAAATLGGSLVTINDEAENTFVLNTFANAQGSGRVWIGYTDRTSESAFTWDNGEAPGYTHWDFGQPDNAGNEDYTVMYSGNGFWNDVGDIANPPGVGPIYGVVEVNPSVDNCASAPAVVGYTTFGFNTIGATTDGPTACSVFTNDVWFTYTACASGAHTLTTCSLAQFDTEIQVLTGSCGALTSVVCNDDACGLQSTMAWNAAAGITYMIRVGGYNGAYGTGAVELTGPACQACPQISVVQGPVTSPENGHEYYRLSTSNRTCAELFAVSNLRGHLVSVDSAVENNFVYNTFVNAPGSGPVWIGLNDILSEGSYANPRGDAATYLHWAIGQPDNGSGLEDVVVLYGGTGPWGNANWIDVQDFADPGVGNVYGVVEVPCPAISILQGPIVNPVNHHTYYRLSTSNWSCAEAYAIEHLNGHLVSINNAAENSFVFNTFANAGGARPVWIGLNDAASENTFVNSDGTPATYTRWAAGQPDNGSNLENYVVLYAGTGPWGNSNWIDVQNYFSPGVGNVYGVVEVTHTAVCPCDWNDSGGVNSQDFFDFITAFFTGNADFNRNGATDSQDFFDFITCFFAPPLACS